MMDFFFKYNETDFLRLPVPPPDFTIQQSNMNQSVTVTNLGEINLWGPEKLSTVTIQSFLPYKYISTYCCYSSFPKPWDSVEKINKWRTNGDIIRLIITDKEKDVDINFEVLIESMDTKMQDASGDIYFTIVLKQYKRISAPSDAANIIVRDTPPTVPTTRTYTVVAGDCLWNIARKYYGDGSKYTVIKSTNNVPDNNLILPGQVLIIP